MEKVLKTIEIADAYQLIEKADYQKLSDVEKVKLWKISRLLKPIAVPYFGDRDDALKSFITPEFVESYRKCKEYEDKKGEGKELPFSNEEYQEYGNVVMKANNLLEETLGQLADKEVTLEFEPISNDALGKLVTSNNWKFSEADKLEWMLGE